MAKISPAKRKQFEDPDLEDFVEANTERAFEVLSPQEAEKPRCVVCGSPLKDVFVTSYGPMGGDCFASLSGRPETRSAYRKMMKLFAQVTQSEYGTWYLWGDRIMSIRIETKKDFNTPQRLVWVRLRQYDSQSDRVYDRTIGYVPEQPGVTEYFVGWARQHNIPVEGGTI